MPSSRQPTFTSSGSTYGPPSAVQSTSAASCACLPRPFPPRGPRRSRSTYGASRSRSPSESSDTCAATTGGSGATPSCAGILGQRLHSALRPLGCAAHWHRVVKSLNALFPRLTALWFDEVDRAPRHHLRLLGIFPRLAKVDVTGLTRCLLAGGVLDPLEVEELRDRNSEVHLCGGSSIKLSTKDISKLAYASRSNRPSSVCGSSRSTGYT